MDCGREGLVLSFLGIQRLHFPTSLAVRWSHVTNSSQRSVSRYTKACFSKLRHLKAHVNFLHCVLPYHGDSRSHMLRWQHHKVVAPPSACSLHPCATLEHSHLLPSSYK